jgi:hypothetical protein
MPCHNTYKIWRHYDKKDGAQTKIVSTEITLWDPFSFLMCGGTKESIFNRNEINNIVLSIFNGVEVQ